MSEPLRVHGHFRGAQLRRYQRPALGRVLWVPCKRCWFENNVPWVHTHQWSMGPGVQRVGVIPELGEWIGPSSILVEPGWLYANYYHNAQVNHARISGKKYDAVIGCGFSGYPHSPYRIIQSALERAGVEITTRYVPMGRRSELPRGLLPFDFGVAYSSTVNYFDVGLVRKVTARLLGAVRKFRRCIFCGERCARRVVTKWRGISGHAQLEQVRNEVQITKQLMAAYSYAKRSRGCGVKHRNRDWSIEMQGGIARLYLAPLRRAHEMCAQKTLDQCLRKEERKWQILGKTTEAHKKMRRFLQSPSQQSRKSLEEALRTLTT